MSDIEALIAKTYQQCSKCGRDVWNTMPEKDRQNIIATHRQYREICGRDFPAMPLCDTCNDREAKLHRVAEASSRLEKAEREGTIPTGLKRYLDPPEELRAMNAAAWRFADAFKRDRGNLLVMGPEGVGKSSLCRYIMAQQYARTSCASIAITGIDIENRFWRFDADAQVANATSTPLLLLDDISNTPWTMRGLACLRQVLDARHEARRTTLITSNADEAELHAMLTGVASSEIYSTSLLRRLRPLKKLTLGGNSYRLKLEYSEE